MCNKENVAKRLKQLRESAKLTQEQLAEKLNLVKSTVSSYENNRSTPDIEMIIAYAKIFNVTSDYILGLTNKKNFKISKNDRIAVEHHENLKLDDKDFEDIQRLLVKFKRENLE